MDIDKIPMVRITWMDALDGDTGWQDLETIMKGDLATCLDPDDKHGGRYITVPKGWVKKIEYLSVGHADVRN